MAIPPNWYSKITIKWIFLYVNLLATMGKKEERGDPVAQTRIFRDRTAGNRNFFAGDGVRFSRNGERGGGAAGYTAQLRLLQRQGVFSRQQNRRENGIHGRQRPGQFFRGQ